MSWHIRVTDVLAHVTYCLKKGREALRPPLPVAREDYLAKQGGPVSQRQLKDFAITVLGIEKMQLATYLSKIPNILRGGKNLLIHPKALSFEKSHLAPIVDYLLRREGCPITARNLFLQNLEVCQELGIATPMLLDRVLQHFYPGDFPLSSNSNGSLTSLDARIASNAQKAAGGSDKPAAARPDKPAA